MIETLQVPKSLPQSEEAERAVLGAALLAPERFAVITGRLRPDDFYFERHRLLYQAMLDLASDDVGIDLRTLQARLEQRGLFEAVGGIAYIGGLDLDLPNINRLESYVEIVKERSVRRRLIQASHDLIRDCLDGGVEAEAALGRAERTILELGEQAISRGFVPLQKVFAEIQESLEDQSTMVGLETGFRDLDGVTHGFGRGNLIIIAGRPGMGKTSFALNIAQNVAIRLNKPVGIFSLEMSQQELAFRVLCSEAGISFKRIRSGHLSQEQWRLVHRTIRSTHAAPMFIDDSANPTLLEINSKARRLKAEKGLAMIIIDYLQLMQAGGKYENRNLEISAISRGLKQLAKELEIPVVALSQLSRQPERRGADHRPQLADLRESGSIEQDADLVAFIYRDEVYNRDDPSNKNMAELIIAKHRSGEMATIPLVFLGETTSFKSLGHSGGDPHAAF